MGLPEWGTSCANDEFGATNNDAPRINAWDQFAKGLPYPYQGIRQTLKIADFDVRNVMTNTLLVPKLANNLS